MKTKRDLATTTWPGTPTSRLKTAWSSRLLLLLLLALPPMMHAQCFDYMTNNGTITITNSTCCGGAAAIPDFVTSIGDFAFYSCTSLTNVTMGSNVTNIGDYAFAYCSHMKSLTLGNNVTSIGESAFDACMGLTSLAIPDGLTNVGYGAFSDCYGLTNLTIPNSVIGQEEFAYCYYLSRVTIGNRVTSIGQGAFDSCTRLTTATMGGSVTSIESQAFYKCNLIYVTVPSSVTNIGDSAFYHNYNLKGMYFKGNAPSLGSGVFDGDTNAIIYYVPGTTGWGTNFGGRPTQPWYPPARASGARFVTNWFGFTIIGTSNQVIVVEACTDLCHPVWFPVGTNTLINGSSYFSDSGWTNHPNRFYRLRSP